MYRDRLPQDHHERAQRIFEDRMAQIFEQFPALNGFCVQHDLSAAEVSTHTWPGLDPSLAVAEGLAGILQDLVAERPDAAERLRGRTFARSFQ